MIVGINHITISIFDLEKSFNFYTQILGCQPLAKWKKGAYLLAGELWLCLSVDCHTRCQVLPEYSHIAFTVTPEEFGNYCQKITELNIKLWKENTSEGDSLYLLDPDGYKLELHVGNWQTRLAAIRQQPYEDLVFFALPEKLN